MSVQDANPADFDIDLLPMRNKFSTKDQYHISFEPKKSGGLRQIEAPNDELKAQQRIVLRKLEFMLEVSHFAHAFVRGKNIASAALPHVRAEVVLTADLSDFFPSVKWAHFDPEADPNAGGKTFKSYSGVMEYVFGKRRMVKTGDWFIKYTTDVLPLLKMCFCDFEDGKGLRLPQGAPTSPLLSNVLLCRLDYRAAWAGYNEKVAYTRYADDLIFSGDSKEGVQRAYGRTVALLEMLNLSINTKKYTLKTGNQRKKIVGLVVNERLNTTRYFRRRLRAMQHHCNVIYTLIELSRQRGFELPQRLKPFLLSKTDGMTFGQKMQAIVKEIQANGGNISMDDIASKNLLKGPGYTNKIRGHRAFQHMVENPPEGIQTSLEFCAVHEILRMA